MTFIGGDTGQDSQEDISHNTRLGINPVTDRDEPCASLFDPFNDGQQINGGAAYTVDTVAVDDIIGLQLVQQFMQPRPQRTCEFVGNPEDNLSISARFGFSIGKIQRIKHLSPYDVIPMGQQNDGYLLLELYSPQAPRCTNAFIGVSTYKGLAWLNDAHVSFDLRELGICEQLIDVAKHLLNQDIGGIDPDSLRYL